MSEDKKDRGKYTTFDMRSSVTLLLLLFSTAMPLGALLGVWMLPSAYAAPDLFAETYGGTNADYAYSVVEASDGDMIVAGYTSSFGAGSADFWVLRLNPDGSIQWQNTYGGTGVDEAYSVAVASDGDIIVAGGTTSFGAGSADFWVLRLNPDGSIVWQNTYGGTGVDEAYSVAVASDGNIIVAGHTTSFGAGDDDFWVLRLNPDGSIVWQNTYGGTADDDVAYSVVEASDGDIIVAGFAGSFGAGDYDFWVLRLNPNGSIVWQNTYGGTGDDEAYSVAVASDGDIIVAGGTTSFGVASADFWVLRLNPDGNIDWQNTYGGTNNDYATSVAVASDSNIIVAGHTTSFGAGGYDFWVLRLNPNGSIVWQNTYGGTYSDYARSVVEASGGDIIVAGYTYSFGAGSYDFWVLRLNSAGSIPDCHPMASTSVTAASTPVSPDDTTVDPGTTGVDPGATGVTPAPTDAQLEKQCPFAPLVGGVIVTIDWFQAVLPSLILISLLGLGAVAFAFTVKRSNRRRRISHQ